jgi:hypothetical protein
MPDIYDATLNPLYRDVLKHYSAVFGCRVQDPDRKGKIESGSDAIEARNPYRCPSRIFRVIEGGLKSVR